MFNFLWKWHLSCLAALSFSVTAGYGSSSTSWWRKLLFVNKGKIWHILIIPLQQVYLRIFGASWFVSVLLCSDSFHKTYVWHILLCKIIIIHYISTFMIPTILHCVKSKHLMWNSIVLRKNNDLWNNDFHRPKWSQFMIKVVLY